MDTLGITMGDAIIVGALIVAGLVGLSVGLVKAILFVGCWIAAGLVSLFAFDHVKPYAYQYIENQLYADITAAAATFLLCLIVLFWISSRFWSAVRKSEFSGLERSLGLFGGIMVGLFLVCVAYWAATLVWREDDQLPEIIAEAKLRPYISIGAGLLRTVMPDSARENTAAAQKSVDENMNRLKDALEAERAMRKLLQSQSGKGTTPEGYGDRSRKDMQRLIESKR